MYSTNTDTLIFPAPASSNWESRIPLGNGRLGVMLKGDPINEGLALNEEFIWSGGPMDRAPSAAYKNLPKIRELMAEGKVPEAQEMAYRAISGSPVNMRCYQSAGDFNIDFFTKSGLGIPGPMQSHSADWSNYKMTLDLSTATAKITYTDKEGTNFTRTVFVSAPDDIIIMHIQSDQKGKINFRGNLERGVWADSVFADEKSIFLEDAHGIPFCAGATVICKGGKNGVTGTCLWAENVDEAVILISIKTFNKISGKNHIKNLASYEKKIRKNTWTPAVENQLQTLSGKIAENFDAEMDRLYNAHVTEYRSYYNRMEFQLGHTEPRSLNSAHGALSSSKHPADLSSPVNTSSQIPTPQMISDLKKVAEGVLPYSPELFADLTQAYANFSRYLLISSSRKPGFLPATLQGIWNCYMDPPWGSKYTININLQMNYWPAAMCALPELENPVFELLERGYKRGRIIARKMYNCPGYVMHHNTDIWGDAAPQDAWIPGTYWTLGSGWLATHIWENFEYTLDLKMLARYYYLIHEACQFYAEFLVPSKLAAPDGNPYLILNPSASPENTYKNKLGVTSVFSEGCEMDNQILTHLFESCLKAHKILGKNAKNTRGKSYPEAEYEKFEYVLKHIKKPSLNSDGSIMEWNEEFEEVEPGHRHISHLYGLFPGHSISPEKTPALAEAANKTLQKRLSGGGGHTGWSQAWIINFRAALYQGDAAHDGLFKLFTHSTNPNLLDIHPPFQIDGNFGALAGIIRMLVQSELQIGENGEPSVKIKLLPALSSNEAWQNGSVRGMRLRGGLFADFSWTDGKITQSKIYGSDTKYTLE